MKFKNIPITKSSEVKNTAWIYLTLDNIIIINWNNTLKEITKTHLQKVINRVSEFSENEKLPVFTMTFDFISINHEAKNFIASEEGGKYTLVNAVLIDNLAKKLIFNFYLKLNKPKIPTRGFTNIDDGLIWLKSFTNEKTKLPLQK
jgi:hypothetical protein